MNDPQTKKLNQYFDFRSKAQQHGVGPHHPCHRSTGSNDRYIRTRQKHPLRNTGNDAAEDIESKKPNTAEQLFQSDRECSKRKHVANDVHDSAVHKDIGEHGVKFAFAEVTDLESPHVVEILKCSVTFSSRIAKIVGRDNIKTE